MHEQRKASSKGFHYKSDKKKIGRVPPPDFIQIQENNMDRESSISSHSF